MTSIQSYNSSLAFTSRKKDVKNDYSGVKVGGALAGVAALNAVGSNLLIKKMLNKTMNGLRLSQGLKPEGFSVFKHLPKSANLYKSLGIISAITIGAGAIVDYCNTLQRKTKKPNAISKNGNEYVRVNAGKIVGAGLGATIVSGYMCAMAAATGMMKALPTKLKLFAVAANMVYGAVGGLALGAITDAMSNHKAAKRADKA